jgi:hypothetical protein
MKQRPWSIVILALFHFISPLGNLFLNSIWAQLPLSEYLRLYFQSHNLMKNYPNLILPILAGIAIYACKKWSFWLYLLAMSGLFIKSYSSYLERASTLSPLVLLFVFSCNTVIVGYFLLPVVREFYFNPRLRWWETSPRYNFEVPAEVRWVQGHFSGRIKNISQSGLYFQSETEISERTDYWIGFVGDHTKFEIHGELIKHPGTKTPSYGFKFDESHRFHKQVNSLIERLHHEGQIVTSRIKGPEDSLTYWLKKLFSTGKGLFPETEKKIEKGP